jgi:MIP family channel proteins
MQPPLPHRLAAETIGTFALVFIGCGAVVSNAQYNSALGLVGIALAFGLVVSAVIYAIGHLSGAHINPAVSVAFAVRGHLPRREAALYVAAQVAGALLAAGLLKLMWPESPGNLGATTFSVGTGTAFVYEALLTALLMFVVMAVATDTRAVGAAAAIAVGATVGLDILCGGAVTGASMNPARSLGPALASGETSGLWLYLIAPIVGALIGALAYQAVRGEQVATELG